MNRLILLLALIPTVTLYWQNRDIPQFGWIQDDALYVDTGKAIATGQGYRLTFLPGEPYMNKYPPVYPMVIAALWKVNPNFPGNLGLIVAWNLLPLIVMLMGLWRLYLSFGFPSNGAALLTFAVACLPIYIYLATSAMTECTFFAMFIWTFVLLEKQTVGYAIAAGVLAGLCYLTRTAALPLFLTVPLCFAMRRKFKPAAAYLAAALPLPIAWQLWVMGHKAAVATDWVTRFYADYASMERLTVGFDNLPIVVWENVDSILTGVGELFIFNLGHDSFLGHHLARLITVVAIAGIIRLVRRSGRWQYGSFALVFTLLLCFWHCPPDQRLFAPLAPLFMAGLWTELYNLWSMAQQTYRRGKSGDRPIAVAFCIVMAAFGVYFIYSTAEARLVQLPMIMVLHRHDTTRIRTTFARVTESTPPDAIIQSDEDVMVHLFTGRHGYRTIVPPRLFYPPQMELVRNTFASLPEAASGAWTHTLVSDNAWKHTLSGDDLEFARKSVAGRADLSQVWNNSGDVLYERKPREVSAGGVAP